MTNAEIASRLVLSEHTVHRHVANILVELGRARGPRRRSPLPSAGSSTERRRPRRLQPHRVVLSPSGIPGRWTRVRERLRDPVVWGNAFLLVKAAGAAVLAWVLAKSVFGLAQPFLAPWAALLTVHATVYRTFARGAQQVASALLGVLLAFAAGAVFGVNAASLGSCCCVALAVGTTRVLRDESTTAATTALVVLLAGYSSDTEHASGRGCSTRCSGSSSGCSSTSWSGRRCAIAPRRGRSTSSTIAWAPCSRDIARAMREGRERARGGAVGRAHPRARSGHLRRLGRPAPGARERPPEPAPRGGRAGRRLARPRAAARAPRAGGGRHAQHGGDDRARVLERRLGPGLPRRRGSISSARAGAAVSEADARPSRGCARTSSPPRASGSASAATPRRGRCRARCIVNLRNILEAMDAVAEAQPVRVATRPAAALGGRRKSIA